MTIISTIIVNWNGCEDTLACIASLRQLELKGITHTIIVVDNASTDESVSRIKKKFPDVLIITNKTNEGFTGGNNTGIRKALELGAQYIWLLNNDTIVSPGALKELVNVLEDKQTAGIAGSKIYFSAGREFHKDQYTSKELGRVLWFAGGVVDWSNMYASHRGVDEVDKKQFDDIEETSFVTGCSMMVRKIVFESVGFFDERYYLYLEDLDFSLRAKQAGFSLWYVPRSTLWHKNAGSTAKPGHGLHQYYITRNRLLVGFSYAPIRTKIALFREALRFLLRGTDIQRKAVVDFLFHRFGNQYAWKP